MSKVYPKGNSTNPKYAFVIDTPSKSDYISGLILSDYTGRLLDKLLEDSKIARKDCYFTYLHSDIQSELNQINAKTNVLLGSKTLIALEKKPLKDWRGSIYQNDKLQWILPTHSPLEIIKQYFLRNIVLSDLVKLESFDFIKPDLYTDKITSVYVAIEYLNSLYGKIISCDIETVRDSSDIICIGFCYENYKSTTIKILGFTDEEKLQFFLELQKLFNSQDTKFIFHNANFDLAVLREWGLICNNLYMDTMHSFHTLYPEFPKSLDFVQSIYTNIPYHKWLSKDDIYKYNGYDCIVTHLIAKSILAELSESNLSEFYFDYIHKLLYPLRSMDRIKIDKDVFKNHQLDIKKKLTEYQLIFNDSIGKSINVNSPKQVSNFIYNELKLESFAGSKTDNLTLIRLKIKYPDFAPIADLIINIRHNSKLLSTYLNDELIEDDYIYTTYNASGTNSGRLSSSAPLWKSGINIQNVSKFLRDIFIPDEGYIFINGDYSQAELRIVSYISNEFRLINALQEEDIMLWIASQIYNTDIKNITDEQRTSSKKLVHAINYGMGNNTLSVYLEKSVREAKLLKKQYFNRFPNIQQWQFDIVKQVEKTGRIITPHFKRLRYFYDRIEGNKEKILSFIPQSMVADLNNTALLRVQKEYEKNNILQPIAHIHDSLLTQCKIEQLSEGQSILKECMNIPLQISNYEVVIPVKIKSGYNWKEVS